MYADGNPKTKKLLKERVKAWRNYTEHKHLDPPPAFIAPIGAFQPGGIFPGTLNGTDTIEGPQFPEPHKWYARVQIVDGIIVKVLG